MADEAAARIAIALDVDDLVAADRVIRQVGGHVGVVKVGLELFTAVGPDAFGDMLERGFAVFADLKLHDIPNTVGRAARVLGAIGVRYLTVHAAGGEAMLRAAVEGATSGAEAAGLAAPIVLAVTVLTSDVDAPPQLLGERAALAAATGCGGVVCAVPDLPTIRAAGPSLVAVTPGIRPAGADVGDQGRPATPAEAITAGSDLLVIGRPITAAPDVAAAAAAIHAEVAAALPPVA